MTETDDTVKVRLFDEAVRIGNQSVTQSNMYRRASGALADAIGDALALMKKGKIDDAKKRLERSLVVTARILGTDVG